MPDFSSLLSKPAGEAKKPPVLDAGDYPGVIKGYELGESSQKKTPYVRFQIGLTGWPDGADTQTREDGTPIDLSTKALRRDYFLTPDALWRLDEMLKSLGIDMAGKSYQDILPETVGTGIIAEVRQGMNQQTNDLFNEVNGIKAAG
jgi:hypothetical protein